MKSLMEFKNFWPIMNRIWPQYRDNEDKQTIHTKFLNHILSNHTISHPNVLELIKISSVAPSTSPLERSCIYTVNCQRFAKKTEKKMSSKKHGEYVYLNCIKKFTD